MNQLYIHINASNHVMMESSTQIRYLQATYQIVCDGELYNLHALYQQLKSEYSLKETMEEVLFYAWYKWSDKAYVHIEGAYSFAIFDGESLLVVKDPLGLRPIYYCTYQKNIYVANSIKRILHESKMPAIMTQTGLLHLFSFGPGIPEDATLFSGIHALAMGTKLQIDHHNIQTEHYYHIPLYTHQDDFETTLQTIHDLLTHSIQAQMQNCQGGFLSGGLDSSIITAVAAKHQKNWRTYSLDYAGNRENFVKNDFQTSLDNAFIEEMVAQTHCQHQYLEIDQASLAALLEEAMLARDQPGMADIDASLLWLCRQTNTQEHFMLSGECSDEIFGGYPWFYRQELCSENAFPWLRYFQHRLDLLHPNIQHFPYEEHMREYYQNSIANVAFLPEDTIQDRRARMHTQLCLHWFMQTLITRQVCEGEYANMTIRAPFANVKLLEYVYNIPWEMKFYEQQEKGILRQAFQHDLPVQICNRKKNPFPKTHNPHYAHIVANMLQERLKHTNSILYTLFDETKLQELINTQGASYTMPWYGQLMSGPQLIAYIYQIDCWFSHYHVSLQL